MRLDGSANSRLEPRDASSLKWWSDNLRRATNFHQPIESVDGFWCLWMLGGFWGGACVLQRKNRWTPDCLALLAAHCERCVLPQLPSALLSGTSVLWRPLLWGWQEYGFNMLFVGVFQKQANWMSVVEWWSWMKVNVKKSFFWGGRRGEKRVREDLSGSWYSPSLKSIFTFFSLPRLRHAPWRNWLPLSAWASILTTGARKRRKFSSAPVWSSCSPLHHQL